MLLFESAVAILLSAGGLVSQDNPLVAPLVASALLLDSSAGDAIKIVSEMSWDTLLLLVGLAFAAVAVLGNVAGKISPGKEGRIAAGIVGACLFAGGIWYHMALHSFRVARMDIVTPLSQSGTCPLTIPLQAVVDVSGNGEVIYDFAFINGNASPLQSATFAQTGSQILAGSWIAHQSVSNASVRLSIASPVKQMSQPSQDFSITCLGSSPAAAVPPAAAAAGPVAAAKAAPSVVVPQAPVIAAHPVNDGVNSVVIEKVQPAPGTYLKTGQRTGFNFLVTYNLATADTAVLSVSIGQSRSTSGCDNGGELVDATEIAIQRGRHEVGVKMDWSGDTGAATKGRIYGAGSLSFTPMFWYGTPGQRGDRFASFASDPAFCYRFGP